MKMKKLFIGVLSVLLVLSMAGMVSGLDSEQLIYEADVIQAGQNGYNSSVVNVTLDLQNDFTVTIPHDFTLVRETVTADDGASGVIIYTTQKEDVATGVKPITVSADVTLLGQGEVVNITVKPYSADYYNDTYTYNYQKNGNQNGVGAWSLIGNDVGEDVELHYLMSAGTSHFMPLSDYVNGKMNVRVGTGSELILSGQSILKATRGTTSANLHVILIDEPVVVTSYESKLTFVVKVDNYDYES